MKKITVLLLTALLLFACDFDSNKMERIPVSGDVILEKDYLDSFSEIIIAGPFDVVLEQNAQHVFQVETYESLMPWVHADVLDDGTLLLYLEDTTESHSFDVHFDEEEYEDFSLHAILSGSRLKWPENEKVLNVVLSVEGFEKIQVLGESDIKLAQTLKAEDFNFEVAGAVHLTGDFDVENFMADLAGAGHLEISGRAEYLEINCAGAGTIKAYDLLAEHVKLEIAGVCNAQLNAEKSLDVDIAGMGTVKYKGDPSVNIDKAGIGSVKKVETDNTNTDI